MKMYTAYIASVKNNTLNYMNFRKGLLILSISVLAVSCSDDEPVSQDGPVAYYDFEGNSNDQAGDFDGDDNLINYIADVFRGENSTTAEFDGVESVIELPSPFDFEKKTISFYLYANKLG